MIIITPQLSIGENEITLEFIRSPGPGGQNVNKLATSVRLYFDVKQSLSLPSEVKIRLTRLAGKKITSRGILIIEARRFRNQERNRIDAIERLKKLILQALQKPRVRRKTKPTMASLGRLQIVKQRRSRLKRLRGSVSDFDQ